jgi:hypothetical protein
MKKNLNLNAMGVTEMDAGIVFYFIPSLFKNIYFLNFQL